MERIQVYFQIVAPEEIDGEKNIEGLELAEQLNNKCLGVQDDQESVWLELDQVDQDIIDKYKLTVDVFHYWYDTISLEKTSSGHA